MNERDNQEEEVVTRIKSNPKAFYAYAKKFSKITSRIGPLLDPQSNTLQNDPKSMADILQQQYSKVFSDPCNPSITKNPIHNADIPEHEIADFEFSTDDIESAIRQMDSNSARGPDKFPAKILKECKKEVS